MADTILGGDFTVYYSADNNRKQIVWSGSTGTYTVNQLYSALADLFDELAQIDDGSVMSAQTPTQYTIGAIDSSDITPWFIDDETTQHLRGGSLTTNLWTRITGTQPGIVKVTCSANTSIVYGDIGNAIDNGTSTGTLLWMTGSGANTVFWIRPTDSSSTHDWSGTAATITCNGHTATSATTDPVYTGEALWANIYSLGSIATDVGANPITDLYVYRDAAKVTGYSGASAATYQWWPTGQFDILMKVKEPGYQVLSADTHTNTTVDNISPNTTKLVVGQPVFGTNIPAGTTIVSIDSISSITISQAATGTTTTGLLYSGSIDGSYVTVYAREYDNTYDYYSVSLSAGGRNPIPLATGDDINNHTGLRQLSASAGSGTFTAGEIAYVGASLSAATAKAVITAVSGTGATSVIKYYLIGDLTDFTGGAQTVTGAVSGATITNGTVADNPDAGNPATLGTPPVISYVVGGYSVDINNGNGSRPYSIQVDVSNTDSLAVTYEWTKYITRRGGVTTTNTDGIAGERYRGIDYRLSYSTMTPGTFAKGATVFQASTGAFGTVMTVDTTNQIVILRNSRGSFGTGAVTDGTNSTDAGTTASSVTPIKANPFGTFAGGKFFGAFGVYFANILGTDAQNYQLTDNFGVVQVPPNVVTVQISGLTVGDGTGVFRTSSGSINKTEYAVSGTPAAGATSITASTAIGSDEPSVGYLRVVKIGAGGNNEEHRYRYSSWSTSTFTLTTLTGNTVTGTTTSVSGNLLLVTLGTAIDANVQVGDMVYNSVSGDYGPVVKIVDTTHIQIRSTSGLTTDWASTDTISFNVLVTGYSNANGDQIYVPIIDKYIASGTTVSNTLTYSADIPVLVRVRQYKSIIPFEQSTTVTSSGLTISAIRTADTIAT